LLFSLEILYTIQTTVKQMSTHTIASGDTFWTLAQRYGCAVEAIINANPGVVPEQLQIGQVIQLPTGDTGSSPPSTQGPLRPTGNLPPNARSDTTLNARIPGWCETLRGMINTASQKANVPADLIAAVIYQESGGNINVDATGNPNGGSDSGLMQVNQQTAGELEQKFPDRFMGISGPAKNIMLGASYLREMYDTNADRDWGITLRAYNSGPNGVDKNDLRARPAGTGDSTYVDKVFRFWSDISQGNDPPADHYSLVFFFF
jgi:murein DD-endopeptidase MepM/ murein hydrolase activator NlpD